MRMRLPLVLASLTCSAACSPADVRREAGHRVSAPAPAAATPASPVAAAESALVTFLEHSRDGHAGPRATADSLLGCAMADTLYQPIAMLADFRLLSSRAAGDTVVALVDVVTVAEEDGDPAAADRFRATQRVDEDTVEFRMTRETAGRRRWLVCEGEQYGFWGADASTTWDPPGASRRTARALADSVYRVRHPTRATPRTTSSAPTTTPRTNVVTTRATGTFEVRLTPHPADEASAEAAVGRMAIDKRFHGALDGTSRGEMLAAQTGVKGSAGYVAIEKVTATLGGRRGSFVLQHSGTMTRGAPRLEITVVPDSGTEQLAGITGTMTIEVADGKHSYSFDYVLPAATP